MAQHKPQSNQGNPRLTLSVGQISYFLTSRTRQAQTVYPAHLLMLLGIAIFIARLMSGDLGETPLWMIFGALSLLVVADLWLLLQNKNSTARNPMLIGGAVLLGLSLTVAAGIDVILIWAGVAIGYSGLRLTLD